MIISIQIILAIILAIYPMLYLRHKARIEFSIGLAVMFGVDVEKQHVSINGGQYYQWNFKSNILCFQAKATWYTLYEA
jgi:hypothetical protein